MNNVLEQSDSEPKNIDLIFLAFTKDQEESALEHLTSVVDGVNSQIVWGEHTRSYTDTVSHAYVPTLYAIRTFDIIGYFQAKSVVQRLAKKNVLDYHTK